MNKIKELYHKYEEILIYLIVGVLTTIVSWGACYVAKFFLDSNQDIQNFIINTISWVAGVLFAYPLNRKWVFKSNNKHILREFCAFTVSRISTWVMDVLIMWLMVNIIPLHKPIFWFCSLFTYAPDATTLDTLNYWFAKICISAVLVTIFNYVFSKLLIFKKKKESVEKPDSTDTTSDQSHTES